MKKQSKLVSAFALIALLSQTFFVLAFAQEFPQAPNEVQNVVAVAGNGQVTLTWDEASDPDGVVNEYKVYYGTTSVETAEDVYTDEINVGKVLTYTVESLANETAYFFAITALDDEQLESDTYSVEVSATPTDPSAKFMKVLSIQQNWDNEIQIEMSKNVFFAGDPRTAFVISDKESGGVLEMKEAQVKDAELIFVMVNDFIPGKAYQLIANTEVSDQDGNTVEEGIMDRIEFVAVRMSEDVPKEAVLSAEETILETTEPEVTNTPPLEGDSGVVQDVRNFSLDTSLLRSGNLIILEWEISSTPDISDQILFTRRGLEDWDSGYSVGNDISELELEVDLDENYEVQLVTIDLDGNESTGVTLSFSTSLSSTGPGAIGTVVALMVLFIIGLVFFKKRHAY